VLFLYPKIRATIKGIFLIKKHIPKPEYSFIICLGFNTIPLLISNVFLKAETLRRENPPFPPYFSILKLLFSLFIHGAPIKSNPLLHQDVNSSLKT
jgi:hypothetical protein